MRAVPQTADPYNSNAPGRIGGASKTSANFFNNADSGQIGSHLKGASSNTLFGGDSTSQPVSQPKKGANSNAYSKQSTNVVADDYDDWDKDDSPKMNNQGGVN